MNLSLPRVTPRLRQISLIVALTALSGCGSAYFGASETPQSTSAQRLQVLMADLRKNPSDAKTLRSIGDEYAKQGDWARSQGSYREAMIVAPTDRASILGYARSQLASGNYPDALSHADRALAAKRDVDALILRGGALAGMNRQAEARAALNEALAQNPRDLDVRSNIALTAALARDPQAYGLARGVAFAPDADLRHRRNLVLVGGITGAEGNAKADGAQMGLNAEQINAILAIGKKARTQGMRAFGVAPPA